MEETKEQQGLYRSLQSGIYISVVLEVFFVFLCRQVPFDRNNP